MYYSQNGEDKIALDFFKEKSTPGVVLDFGANDGKTFSNSLALIERMGWKAYLIEASSECYDKLIKLHGANPNVIMINKAIGTVNGVVDFFESGALLGNGDSSLVSTTISTEKQRWDYLNMQWDTKSVECMTYATMKEIYKLPDNPDFISIDVEGLDYDILTQIDLSNVGMVCVEHNGVETEKYKSYCESFGMKEIHRNLENIIMVRYRGPPFTPK